VKPKLNNIKSTGFRTPDNYFDTVEDTVMHALTQKEPPLPAERPGFDTPNNYFDNLEDKILQRIEKEDGPRVIQLFSRRNLLYASGIAAAVLLLFNLSIFSGPLTLDDLDTETVENYIIDEGIDPYELAILFADDELIEENIMEQQITDETLEDYLLENLDIEDLIIE
jgi:hypothetical protein